MCVFVCVYVRAQAIFAKRDTHTHTHIHTHIHTHVTHTPVRLDQTADAGASAKPAAPQVVPFF